MKERMILKKGCNKMSEWNETVDTDTHCPVCGFENEKYANGETTQRYCGCEDEHEGVQ